MRKGHGAVIGAAIGVAGMLAIGAPLVAQPGSGEETSAEVRAGNAAEREARAAKRAATRAERVAARANARSTFIAPLLGKNEVDPATGKRRAGDPDGSGAATVVVKGTQLCWAVAVKGIGDPVGLHIHQGRAHKNGDVVVPLSSPATGDPGASAGCVDVAEDLATKIQRRPRGFYVNIHTADYGNGALRGQLRRMPRGV